MIKNILLFLTISSAFSAEKYVLIYFHGQDGFMSSDIRERKKLPDELFGLKINKVYDSSHNIRYREFKKILEIFGCNKGTKKANDLGLIIIGWSWGARRAYEFSKDYFENCGVKADFGYLVDGVQKPIIPFRHPPISNYCKNFYKTVFPVSGRSLENCNNVDLTKECKDLDGLKCHQAVIGKGLDMVIEDIRNIPQLKKY
jgi:hypothetical protein